ncbi:MAG: [FeFe] hydrogenase H-cluster maturation GTPase HydF [Clostridiales bacterium]|mgnify:CR=1 FL=1|nr:[FeFe] hydrogenase H-cluster maturation GTPase HydF [Clostridiales bacterium]
MTTLNETPRSNRLHIGIFGRTNSGKSSFINAFTGQEVSIVADVAGTTTDPVYKSMEIYPLGPCVIIDTAGFDDESELGGRRIEKTKLAAEKTDIAVILISAEENAGEAGFQECFLQENTWYRIFQEKKTPVLFVVSKSDLGKRAETLAEKIRRETGEETLLVSTVNGEGMDKIKTMLTRLLPENYGAAYITGNLVKKGDLVLLVMPQDIQAPKGRLILPQVQTIRELLDKKCHVMSVTTDQFTEVLPVLTKAPKLIITDSQIFDYVYKNKPKESMLTSFSVLFAAYKGDISCYIEGAGAIDALTEQSKVLIAECCTHAPLQEDIGRVKLPRMLRKRVGEGLQVDLVSGMDFPEKLTDYDLVIQCGACMFNRKYVLSRIERAKKQAVPMTNYGVAIAHLTGILPQVAVPSDDLL